jgi:dephospho-CoA kinase
MKRILITGMSGTGKSTLIGALVERGYKAVDADCDEFSQWVTVSDDNDTAGSPVEANRDWVWREDRIQALLDTEDTDVLFMSGCASNMGKFLSRFAQVVLLSAPADVIVERVRTRTTNSYGKRPSEVARILDLIESVEPLLREVSDQELNTNALLEDVMTAFLRLTRLAE